MSILARARPLMLARLASAALTFVIPLVLARVFTPAEYGTFKQSWLVSNTLYFVLQLGLAQSLYYFLPREPGKRALYLTQAAVSLAALGGIAATALAASGPVVARYFGNPALVPLAPWIGLTTFFMVAGAPYDIALTAQGRIRSAAVARVAIEGARAMGMVIPAWWTHSLHGLMVGLTIASALRLAGTWWVTLSAGRVELRWESLKRQLAYALPFGAATALAIPQQQFHQYAVGSAASAAAFAIYSVGCFQLPVVDLLYTPVSDILQVGIAKADGEGQAQRAAELFREAVAQLALAFMPLVAWLFAVAPAFISLLYTRRYVDAAPIFRVGIFVVPLAALPLEGLLRARAQTRFFFVTYAVKIAFTVPAVLLLLRVMGPIGAMVGYVLSEAVAKGMMLHRAGALFERGVRSVLPGRELRAYAAAAIVAALPAWAAVRYVPSGLPVALGVSGLLFSAAYLGLLAATGHLAPLEMLRRSVRSRRAASLGAAS